MSNPRSQMSKGLSRLPATRTPSPAPRPGVAVVFYVTTDAVPKDSPADGKPLITAVPLLPALTVYMLHPDNLEEFRGRVTANGENVVLVDARQVLKG